MTANSDLYLLLIKEVEVKIALIENPLQEPQQLKKNIEEIASTQNPPFQKEGIIIFIVPDEHRASLAVIGCDDW